MRQSRLQHARKPYTEVEKIISELEDNPNSPFHKLVNLDEQKQKLSELQKKEVYRDWEKKKVLNQFYLKQKHKRQQIQDFHFCQRRKYKHLHLKLKLHLF